MIQKYCFRKHVCGKALVTSFVTFSQNTKYQISLKKKIVENVESSLPIKEIQLRVINIPIMETSGQYGLGVYFNQVSRKKITSRTQILPQTCLKDCFLSY